MKKIGDLIKLSSDEVNLLKQNYIKKLDNRDFRELVSMLNTSDEILMQYTSSLEDSSIEFSNCRGCKGLEECKNKIKGCMYTPKLENDKIIFSYVTCNYQNKKDNDTKYQENVYLFEIPKKVKEASLKDLYKNDKNRVEFMKYVKTFIDELGSKKKTKGIYLHGSYGTGKTYLIAALFNELAKRNIKSAIIYVPEFLRVLKSSFGADFEDKYDYIKRVPLLLLDDIGAEYLTPWARDEILGTILQYRMDEELPTFFTSNLNLKQLEEHFSITSNGKEELKARRMIERIKDMTKDFELVGESNRGK